MSERLVRHKPSKYRYAESTAMVFAMLLTMTAARIVEQTLTPPHPAYGLPIIAMVLTLLLYPLVATIWARFQNLELMPYEETVRRAFQERTSVSLFDTAWRIALLSGSMTLFIGLTAEPIQNWPDVVPVVAVTLLLGFVAGTYAALYARRWRDGAQDFSAIPPATASEREARHYFGYSIGLAAAFSTASQLGTGMVAAAAIGGAFVAGKFVADLLLPQPPINFGAPLRVRWSDPLTLIVFGALHWGAPLALLSWLVVRTISPNLPLKGVLPIVIAPLAMGGAWAFLFWLIALFARRGQKPKATVTA